MNIIFTLIALAPNLGGVEVINTSEWKRPVYAGKKSLLTETRVYVFDKSDLKVKVYDVQAGLQSPRFLWETPGQGQGPGELNDQFLVNIAENTVEETVWLSSSQGFLLFTMDGQFVREIKQANNRAFVAIKGDSLLLTCRSPIVNRDYALRRYSREKFLEESSLAPNWTVDFNQEIPVLRSGGFLQTSPEVVIHGQRILRYDSGLGELMEIDDQGNVVAVHQVKQTDPEDLQPIDFRPYNRPEILKVSRYRDPFSGIHVNSDHSVWLVTRRYTSRHGEERVLNRFSLLQGKSVARYRLAGLGPRGRFFLIGMHEDRLFLFDTEEGDQIYGLDPTKLAPLIN